MVVGDDAQKPYELLWLLEMILASYRCCPQLLHPHVEDDHTHVEDEHPLHPLQGRSLLLSQAKECTFAKQASPQMHLALAVPYASEPATSCGDVTGRRRLDLARY
jgi:hypothetical protein